AADRGAADRSGRLARVAGAAHRAHGRGRPRRRGLAAPPARTRPGDEHGAAVSLLDELIERAGDEVDEHADDWLARGLEAARREVERRREELRAQVFDPGYDPEQKRVEVETALLAHAGDAIEVLDEHRDAVAALGRARFAAVLVQLGA